MAIDTTVWASDLAAMIADLPINAKFGSATFTCAASDLSTEETLILTGNDQTKAVRVIFPVTAFAVTSAFKPQARLMLKFPDAATFTNYEIVEIKKSSDLLAFEVLLKADNRAA